MNDPLLTAETTETLSARTAAKTIKTVEPASIVMPIRASVGRLFGHLLFLFLSLCDLCLCLALPTVLLPVFFTFTNALIISETFVLAVCAIIAYLLFFISACVSVALNFRASSTFIDDVPIARSSWFFLIFFSVLTFACSLTVLSLHASLA